LHLARRYGWASLPDLSGDELLRKALFPLIEAFIFLLLLLWDSHGVSMEFFNVFHQAGDRPS
jgi:hypothetical protein